MKLRHLAVSLLLSLAPALAHASFPASAKWVLYGATGAYVCHKDASGACELFETALDAGMHDLSANFCPASPNPWYSSGTFPNELWRVGKFSSYPSCSPTWSDNWVGQWASGVSCPRYSSLSGSTCTCNTGYYELGNACYPPQDKNVPCPPGGCPGFVGNPISPATGNKFERQRIYTSEHGLDFSLAYNSQVIDRGSFGHRWRGSFDRRIKIINGNAVSFRADGKSIAFVPSAGSWTPDDDIADVLTELTSGGVRTGWTLYVAGTEETESYDAAGKLTSIVDRHGRALTMTYSDGTLNAPNGGPYLHPNGVNWLSNAPMAAGLLIKVTDHYGRGFHFIYYQTGNVGRIQRPGGGANTYYLAYDNAHRLTSITFPDTRVRSFVWDEAAHTGGVSQPYMLTGIVDENGDRYATFAYDSQGRAVSTEHAGGLNKYTVTYGSGSADVTDPLNETRTYGFQDVLGAFKSTGVTGSACPACGPKAQTFDANGNVATRTDWNNNRTDYAYDTTRNLETSRTEALTSAGATTSQTRTITSEWHSSFRLPTRIAEPLRLTTYVYNGDSGASCGFKADGVTLVPGVVCSKTIQATTDTNGSQGLSATTTGTPRTWTYTYNEFARVLTVNGPRTDVTDTTTYTYHGPTASCGGASGCRGQVATITNAAGHVTQITNYEIHGAPLAITDPNGLAITLAYDERRRLSSRSVGGETTSYTYDFAGQLTRVTLPDGSYLNYTYDDAHRITQMEDNLGNRIVYTLDDMGNRTVEDVRDPSSNLVQTRGRVYSSLNRLFQEIGALSQTTEYTYDDQGNVLTVNGPLSGTVDVTSNQYDALNRLKQVTDPSSSVTQYAYNGLDALTQVTDPRSLATSYTVDGLGNLTQQASPDTGTTANTYDAAGNLLTQTDAKSQVTTYSYDALNRVTQILFHDGAKHLYGYDAGTNGVGRLTSIDERNPSNVLTNKTSYAYDQKGRVSSLSTEHAGVTYAVGYSYDSAGRLSAMTYPSGRTLAYSFDSLGRVSTINTTFSGQTQPIVWNVAYHPFGGVKSYTLGNGQTYTRSYDQDGRIGSYTLAGTSYAVLYDDASRIQTISETLNPPNTNTYGYDALDRLTGATLPGTSYAYTYDAVGNRLTRTAGASTDTYAYGSTSNRIASITPTSGPVRSFTLDANGSTTADGLNSFTYDIRGRMVQSVSSFGTTDYKVNALGQRMRKTNSATDTVFHYDSGGRLIAETSPTGTLKREVIYLGDIPVAVVQ
jgi:YD repeat-containing protein